MTVYETKTPEITNYEWRVLRKYDMPPYDCDYVVKTVKAGQNDYVRVYRDDNKLGRWLMKKTDIEGLTPLEIKDKFSLSEVPTHVCDVKVPPTQKLNTGIAAGVKEWGTAGGGHQFDTGDTLLSADCYVNERVLGGQE